MSLCNLGVSCEQPACEHGRQVRIERCYLCELQKQITTLTDMYKDLSIRVVAQHEFKIRQIDENRKISRRVDDLEETLQAFDEDLKYLDELKLHKRVSELEKSKVKPTNECNECSGSGEVLVCTIATKDYQIAKKGERIYLHKECHTCHGKDIVPD